MKTIDEYKKEILLRVMRGEELDWTYVRTLPKNDELRSLMCELRPEYACIYAERVDKCPHEETRKAACREAATSYIYAAYVNYHKAKALGFLLHWEML